MLLVSRILNWFFSNAIGLNSFDKISMEMFLVKFDSSVKLICCLLDQFFIRHIDGKYRSAIEPLVDYFTQIICTIVVSPNLI